MSIRTASTTCRALRMPAARPTLHAIARAAVLAATVSTGIGVAVLQAQTPPDAGALQREIERSFQTPLPGRSNLRMDGAPARLSLPDEMRLQVRQFSFEGNTVLSTLTLEEATRGWLNTPVGLSDLQAAARAVAETYREAGWIVTTWLPAQDVTEGRVTIRIVEARFAGARIEDPQPTRMSAQRVLSYFEANQPQGQMLRAPALDRALLLADDLPGVAVSGVLEPGAQEGETGVAVRVVDEPLFSGEAALDNAGARSTGAERATLAVRAANPAGIGDQATANLIKSRGVEYGRIEYTLPVGADGLRVGANASAFRYRLVGSDFQALDASGRSHSVGVSANYPLLRTRATNVYAQAVLDHKSFRNRASGALQSSYDVDAAMLGLTGNAFDEIGGGGTTRWAVSLIHGTVRQGAHDPGEDSKHAGFYRVLRASMSRQQTLTSWLTGSFSLTGQYSNRDLDSSERMSLGGPGAVRAYPVNEGSGSRGVIANTELRWRVNPQLQASVFHDIGQVSSRSSAMPSSTLQGAGVAVSWNGPGVDVSATLARRIGSNPHPSANGSDQDGSKRKLRPWLQLTFMF